MNRTVKFIFCLILVVGMLGMLAACSEDISGHYTIVKVSVGDTFYNYEDLMKIVGTTEMMYIDINSDGTGYMTMLGSSSKIFWEGDKIWAEDNGTKATFTVEGNTLTLYLPESTMVFQK